MKKISSMISVFFLAGIFLFAEASFLYSQNLEPEMILVPSGNFQMGSDEYNNAMPVHSVTLTHDFYMSKYEITNQQFAVMLNYALTKGYLNPALLAENTEKKAVKCLSKSPQKLLDLEDEDCQIDYIKGKFESVRGKENMPVIEVSWYGAAFYCNMLSEQKGLDKLYNLDDWSCRVYGKEGFRLPTEAEWEYAARFNDERLYPWGKAETDISSYANCNNIVGEATVVGKYSPKGNSSGGICDLAGNVAEWCNDWYDIYSGSLKEIDPEGPPSSPQIYIPIVKRSWPLRVIRGGSFKYDPSHKDKEVPFRIDSLMHADSLRSNFRSFDYPGLTRPVEGFRPVKIGKRRVYKEVKFIAGPDKKWFSYDDEIYHYYSYEYDERGIKIKKKCSITGKDKFGFNSDDELQFYQVFEHSIQSKLTKETSYNGKGKDLRWFTPDDIENYHSVYEYDHLGNKIRVIRYNQKGDIIQYMTFEYNDRGKVIKDTDFRGKGEDNEWFSSDDEIEKYHKFKYDDQGRLIWAMEYHSRHQGRGRDGKWFTFDDSVYATKKSFYNNDSLPRKEEKYIGSGPDKEWFNEDDILQYYVIFHYTTSFNK